MCFLLQKNTFPTEAEQGAKLFINAPWKQKTRNKLVLPSGLKHETPPVMYRDQTVANFFCADKTQLMNEGAWVSFF